MADAGHWHSQDENRAAYPGLFRGLSRLGKTYPLWFSEELKEPDYPEYAMIKCYIGLDVHKSSISVAYGWADREEPIFYGKLGGSNQCLERGLRKMLKALVLTKEEVSIAYEAGPCGFVAARRLQQLGYEVIVAAPSKIERAAGDKIKTDRRDSLKLARQHRSGDLTAVHIPEVADEAIRDVCRARTDASEDARKAKQRLGAFLLRNGIHYTGKTAWTPAHMRYLRGLKLPFESQAIVLEEYLLAIDRALDRVERLEKQMEQLLAEWERAPFVEALMAFRGFQRVAAMTVVSEIGDFSRFEHPRQLMAYLGLVPGEDSSGKRRRQGAITKCGNAHARWMLVECAHHYGKAPKVSVPLSKRQEGQSKEVKELSWRAQTRMHGRFARLSMRQLNRNKVVVAVARELCGFIWELMRLVTAITEGNTALASVAGRSQKSTKGRTYMLKTR
jgi:transposase